MVPKKPMPGDPPAADNTPAHEDAETTGMETQEGGEEASPNVTPEEQSMYDSLVNAALDMIYVDGNSFEQILSKIKNETQGQGLAFGIGHTAAMILRSIVSGIKQQGKEVPEDILLPAGQEVVAELVEVCVRAGLAKPSDEEQLNAEAMMNGVQEYGKAAQASGEIDPATQEQAKQEFAALKGGPTQQPDSLITAAKGA